MDKKQERSFSIEIPSPDTSVFCYYENSPVKFKLAFETAKCIKNLSIPKAVKYLSTVLDRKNCIPMTRYNLKVGRTRQARVHGFEKGKWPTKVCEYFIKVLENLIKDAEKKSLNIEELKLTHLMVNKAPKRYGRRHSAFGRVKAYNSSPCHLEIVASLDQKLEE